MRPFVICPGMNLFLTKSRKPFLVVRKILCYLKCMNPHALPELKLSSPLSQDDTDAFREALPKLLIFVHDKFLLDSRAACGEACRSIDLLTKFNFNFGGLLLGTYEFGLYGCLADELALQIAELDSRGIKRAHVESLLKSWMLAIQSLVKRRAADRLIPALEWLHQNSGLLYEKLSAQAPPLDETGRAFFDLLMAKNRKFAAEYILARIRDGRSIESVYAAIVLPALQHIRFLWIKNSISAADEHAAGDICRYIIFRIIDSIFGERQYPFKALVACMQGEENVLGAEVLANFLEIKGWVVSFLGHDASDEDIVHALSTSSPQVAVLSVSSISRLPAAKSLIQEIRKAVPQVKIILEGRAALLARQAFQPLSDGIISGFEEGHAAMLTLVTAHA